MTYYVKFVKWNANTISNLINKTVKFSTVFEFNDFNEYIYSGVHKNYINEELKLEVEKAIKKWNYQKNFQQYVNEFWAEKDADENVRDKHLYELFQQEEYKQAFTTVLGFSSVGMFCVSGLEVFKNDAAQLMFAHYADNLRGLALVYEINHTKKVEYNLTRRSSFGEQNRILAWARNEYNDMQDFLSKSKYWKYEKEHRVFATPDIHMASDNGITLKAILHTRRFDDKLTLQTLSSLYYNNKIEVIPLLPSFEKPKFRAGGKNAYNYLLKNL